MRQSFFKSLLKTLCLSLLVTGNTHAGNTNAGNAELNPTLTELETKWLRAGLPVLDYADEHHLPIDIVVQIQAGPNDVPLGMGTENGRCKLVFSMRANPEAESIILNLPAELQVLAIEAMFAHEVAHCWRYMNGTWHALPAGFVETVAETGIDTKLAATLTAMRNTRREEGFADLVGLAWILRNHPDQYAAIHAWFEQVRADQPIDGSYHDTRIWLALAAKPQHFPSAATPFEQARQLWTQGLLSP